MPHSPDQDFVFHGSPSHFGELAIPRRNIRTNDGKIVFDQNSFHTTPYKWIAVAYTYDGNETVDFEDRKVAYSMAVSLRQYDENLLVLGFESLERSLEKLFGKGGFVYWFNKDDFHWTEGLGKLELITNNPLNAVTIERVDDPIRDLNDAGIKFLFRDLSDPKNAHYRNYK